MASGNIGRVSLQTNVATVFPATSHIIRAAPYSDNGSPPPPTISATSGRDPEGKDVGGVGIVAPGLSGNPDDPFESQMSLYNVSVEISLRGSFCVI